MKCSCDTNKQQANAFSNEAPAKALRKEMTNSDWLAHLMLEHASVTARALARFWKKAGCVIRLVLSRKGGGALLVLHRDRV